MWFLTVLFERAAPVLPRTILWKSAARARVCASALLVALAGCAGDSNDRAESALPAEVEAHYVYDTQSPAYYVATDGRGTSLALLAAKDEKHNAVAITGVLFAVGDEWLRYQVDSEGRPQRIETPRGSWLMGNYSESGFDVYSARAGEPPLHERVALAPGEYGALSIAPQRLGVSSALEKATLPELLQFPEQVWQIIDCAIQSGRPSVARLVLKCGDAALGKLAEGRVPELIQALATLSSAGVCATSAVGLFGGVTTPGAVAGLLVSCGAATGGILELSRTPAEHRFARGLVPKVEAELVEDQSSPILVYLEPRLGDEDLHTVEADLALVGGSSRQPLSYNGTRWQWSGRVKPPEPYSRFIAFIVDGSEYVGADLVDVRPKLEPFALGVQASSLVVPRGQSVTLTAQPSNGVAPYRVAWAVAGQLWPEEATSITHNPEQRTLYELAAVDSTPGVPFLVEASLWVAVCGDGECSPEESTGACPADCPAETSVPSEPGEPSVPPAVTTCGPGSNRDRYQITGTGAWDDSVLDTTTGLTWHRNVEHSSAELPACEYGPVISAATPYCCKPPSVVPYQPGCNYLGFKALCESQGMRLATIAELEHFGRDEGTCFDNWESWAELTSPTSAGFVRVTGVLVSTQEYLLPGDKTIWYASDHVRCVR